MALSRPKTGATPAPTQNDPASTAKQEPGRTTTRRVPEVKITSLFRRQPQTFRHRAAGPAVLGSRTDGPNLAAKHRKGDDEIEAIARTIGLVIPDPFDPTGVLATLATDKQVVR